MKFFASSSAVGAYSAIYAATSAEIRSTPEKYKGALITPPNKLTTISGQAADPQRPSEIWELSEKVVADIVKDGKVSTVAGA